MSGAAAGAVMAARQGPKSIAGSALVGGMLLGLIEGMGLLMNNFMSQQYRPVDPREEQQAMQMPEDSASLGQQQEGGLLKGIFSWEKSKCAFFIQFEKPWIDCKVVCIVVRLAATQHFNMQYSIDKVADSTCVALNVPFPKLILNGVINESIDFWFLPPGPPGLRGHLDRPLTSHHSATGDWVKRKDG